MTLKNIKFSDSPVMRQLERNALKDGIIVPVTEDIVKNASEKKDHAPTNNLFIDLVCLADDLRSKGYVQQAQALEEKIIAYKKAAQEYNSELDAAHPDGDVEMGKASNGLGDVETLESAHEKIVEVVNKKPTGKQASVENILKAVGGIFLGEGVKTAQEVETYDQIMGTPKSPEADAIRSKNEAHSRKIEEINNIVSSQVPSIMENVKIAESVENLKFSYDKVVSGDEAYLGLYSQFIKKDLESIKNIFSQWDFVYGKGGSDIKTIIAKLESLSKDESGMRQYVDYIQPGIFEQYFPKPAEEAQTSFEKNTDTVKNVGTTALQWAGPVGWLYQAGKAYFDASKASDKIHALANALNEAMLAKRNSVVGAEQLKAANFALTDTISRFLEPLKEVEKNISSIPSLDDTSISNSSVLLSIKAVREQLTKWLNGQAKSGVLYHILQGLTGTNPIIEALTRIESSLKELYDAVGKMPIGENDRVVAKEVIDPIVGSLITSAKIVKNYIDALVPKDSSSYKAYQRNIEVFATVAERLSKSAGKSYAEIYGEIQEFFPKATSFDKLQVLVSKYSAATTKMAEKIPERTGTTTIDLPQASASSENIGIKKTSQVQIDEDAPPKNNTPAKSAPVTGGSVGLAKANMNDPKEAAVAYMQQMLAYFAQSLSSPANKDKFTNYNPQDAAQIVRTGPKANPAVNSYDGKWGVQTQAALDLAKKYLDQLKLVGVDSKARYVNKINADDTEAVAKSNATLLSKATQLVGGLAPNAGAASIVRYGRVNGVYVFSNDIDSLQSFYKFITKNNWVKEESQVNESGTGDVTTGVNLQGFLLAINAVVANAKAGYNKASQVTAQYYQSAINLWKQINDLIQRFQFDTTDENLIIPYDALPGVSSENTSRNEGAAGKRKSPGMGQGAPYEDDVDEGGDWAGQTRRQNTPPIILSDDSKDIDLNSGWYPGFITQTGVRTSLLGFDDFASTTAEVQMYNLFPGRSDARKGFNNLLNSLPNAIATARASWEQRVRPNALQRREMNIAVSEWNQVIAGLKRQMGIPLG